MKSKIYILFILFFTFNLQAQKMLEEDNLWYTNVSVWAYPPSYGIYKIGGDTIIDNTSYKQILISTDSTLVEWNVFSRYVVRENDEGQVFAKLEGEEERLMYDFSLEVGDTMPVASFYAVDGYCYFEVTAIDSVMLMDGSMRKRLHLENEYYPEWVWIEGLGSLDLSAFYIDYICVTDIWAVTTCYFKNGEQLYENSEGYPCYDMTTSVNNLSKDDGITLHPNPVTDHLFIKSATPNHSIRRITIFNTIGSKVKTISLSPNQESLDLEFLKNGVYVLLLEAREGEVFSKRIVKQ